MKTTLIRILGPAAGLALVSCAGMNPWASNPPRHEQTTTDSRYNSGTENPNNPYLKDAQGEKPAAGANSTTTTTTSSTNTAANNSGTETPPTPPPPNKKDKEKGPEQQPPSSAPPPSPPAAPTAANMPFGKPVPGKKGFVYSPYDQSAGMIDVRDIAPGTKVRDPYTGKVFLVP